MSRFLGIHYFLESLGAAASDDDVIHDKKGAHTDAGSDKFDLIGEDYFEKEYEFEKPCDIVDADLDLEPVCDIWGDTAEVVAQEAETPAAVVAVPAVVAPVAPKKTAKGKKKAKTPKAAKASPQPKAKANKAKAPRKLPSARRAPAVRV